MHNGFLQVEGKKMSKSDGNFVTIADVLKDWPGEVARFNMVRTHYRQPIDWTVKSLEESRKILESWNYLAGDEVADIANIHPKVFEGLLDDLNFSEVVATLHFNRSTARISGSIHERSMAAALDFLGLRSRLNGRIPEPNDSDRKRIVRLVEDRLLARHNKDWKESDRIRDELAAMGIAIKDNKDGTTTWEVNR
jgi:cysteinyl-tRNA synthetase